MMNADKRCTSRNEECGLRSEACDKYSSSLLIRSPCPYDQVAQETVASMVPDDLTTPAHVRLDHTARPSLNVLYTTFKSSAQETQLKSFLTYAAYVLESLVMRPVQQASTRLCDLINEDHTLGRLTEGSLTLLKTDEFLDGRPVHFTLFKEASSTSFLCCYGPGPSSSTHEYVHQGCICIFDVISKPTLQFTLLVQGVPLCASWSINAGRDNWGVIVAGAQDGSLALWDLSSKLLGTYYEPCKLHPTYSTSYRIEENHTAPIQKVSLDGNSLKEVTAAGLTGKFLQLLSMDKLGFVHMWIVKEVQGNTAGEDEPGLDADGRLYLVRTGKTSVLPRTESLEIALPEACTFATIPGQVQEILVGMSDGTLVKTSLVGSRPSAPRRYTRQALEVPKPVPSPILSLCFSPFVEDCFLVAYANSTVAIFTTDSSYPWGIWTLPSNESDSHIISAQWSPFHSTVFLVAVTPGTVHVFDMSHGLANPALSETLGSSEDIVRFEVSKLKAKNSSETKTEHSFVTANVAGYTAVHLLKRTSNEWRAECLKNVLHSPIQMI